MILVATIEHSGSMKLLELLGWDKKTGKGRRVWPLYQMDQAGENDIVFAHLTNHEMPMIKEAALKAKQIIVTDRRRDLITATWQRDQRPMKWLAEQFANYDYMINEMRPKPYVMTLGEDQ